MSALYETQQSDADLAAQVPGLEKQVCILEAELATLRTQAEQLGPVVEALATLGSIVEANNSIIKRFCDKNPLIAMQLMGEYINADTVDAEQTLARAHAVMNPEEK